MNTSLTSGQGFGNAGFPLIKQGVSVAFAVPHTVRSAVFLVFATKAPLWVLGTYWQNDVRVSVRPRRLW